MKNTINLLSGFYLLLALVSASVHAETVEVSEEGIDPIKEPVAYACAVLKPRMLKERELGGKNADPEFIRDTMIMDVERARPFEALKLTEIADLFFKTIKYRCGHLEASEYHRVSTILSEIRPQVMVGKLCDLLEILPNYDLQALGRENVTNAAYATWSSLCPPECFGNRAWRPDINKARVPGCSWEPESYSARPYTCLFFWWFVGRGYSREIFADWYSCWTAEHSRPTPREVVVNQLCEDIYKIFHIVMPAFARVVEDGDESVLQALRYMNQNHPTFGFNNYAGKDRKSFLTWWDLNKNLYGECDPREGAEKAMKCEKNYGRIFDSAATCKSSPEDLQKITQSCIDYYSGPHSAKESAYWYHKLPDEEFTAKELAGFIESLW